MSSNPAKLVIIVALLMPALLFVGCSSGYTRAAGVTPSPAMGVSSPKHVTSVSVELTGAVKEKLRDSLKFDSQALGRTIELALTNRQLLDKAAKESAVSMEITITHVRVRNTFNAVMWGAMSGNDSIKGDIVMKDASGAITDKFHVDTSYALGGWAGGQDSMRMNWLYEAFAKQVVAAIAGDTKKA